MCRDRKEIESEEPIIREIDRHIEKNNLGSTDKLMLDLMRENHIQSIITRECLGERERYPSLLYLALNRPRSFFPFVGALLILFVILTDPATLSNLFSLFGKDILVQPGDFVELGIPAVIFLTITGIFGTASYKE